MGHQSDGTCLECGATFPVSHGGGFFFHLLRCDKCGKTKSISFDRLGELHLRYVKGLSGPYCVASSRRDKAVRERKDLKPLAADEYNRRVEEFAGKCRCRGKYVLHAPPRCPKCRSTRIKEDGPTVLYD